MPFSADSSLRSGSSLGREADARRRLGALANWIFEESTISTRLPQGRGNRGRGHRASEDLLPGAPCGRSCRRREDRNGGHRRRLFATFWSARNRSPKSMKAMASLLLRSSKVKRRRRTRAPLQCRQPRARRGRTEQAWFPKCSHRFLESSIHLFGL